eukprot:scaffold33407_cov112-Isochrysis_galbana.AAC.8
MANPIPIPLKKKSSPIMPIESSQQPAHMSAVSHLIAARALRLALVTTSTSGKVGRGRAPAADLALDERAVRCAFVTGRARRHLLVEVIVEMPHGFVQSRDSWPNSSQLKHLEVLTMVPGRISEKEAVGRWAERTRAAARRVGAGAAAGSSTSRTKLTCPVVVADAVLVGAALAARFRTVSALMGRVVAVVACAGTALVGCTKRVHLPRGGGGARCHRNGSRGGAAPRSASGGPRALADPAERGATHCHVRPGAAHLGA